MSYVTDGIKGKYHLGLNGQGLILQGAPDRLAYEMKQAPIYGNRFAQGDRSYGDFSFWWFWTQTDWSGGLKEDPNWADDAKFVSSKNLDGFSIGGQLKILDKPTIQTTDLSVNSANLNRIIYGTIDDGTNSISRFFLGNRASTVDASNGCKLWQSSDGDTWTLINEFLNVTAINDLFTSIQTLFIMMTSELYVCNDATTPFVTVTERTTEFNTSGLAANFFNCGCDVNGVAYVVGATLAQTTIKTSTDDGATFTERILLPIGVKVFNSVSFNGKFYYLAKYGNITGLYYHNAITDAAGTLVYEFSGLTPTSNASGFGTNSAMVIVGGALHLQFSDGSIWSCTTGNVVTREYENRNSILPTVGGRLINHKEVDYGKNVVIKRNAGVTSIYNNRRNIADNNHLIPSASDGSTILYINEAGDAADNNVYRNTGSSYFASGNFVTSEYAEISAIDKLYYDVTCNFAALASGESIEVEYSTNGGSSYTSIGTASFSADGAITNKNFLFGDNIVSKTLVLRITLAGGGTTTPTLKDFSTRFIPIVSTKKLWNLNVNCGDEVKRLDGGLVTTVGRELKNILEGAWWTKSILDFQDLDYATTLLNGALNSSATTITVDDTYDFPEQGRIRIENEEITYTGKTPTTFTGCTRGARETKATSHSDNTVVNNAYKVIITDLQYRVPIALKDRALEYAVGISLREV